MTEKSKPMVAPIGVQPEMAYNIAGGVLRGRIDGVSFVASAGSGGRAGSKTPGAVNWWLANNPLATGVRTPKDESRAGGPLPMGIYRVVPHEHHADRLRLLPLDPAAMQGRHSMQIHGRGKHGSFGCIVPTDFNNVLLICKLVRARVARGGKPVHLRVFAEGTDLDLQNRTA